MVGAGWKWLPARLEPCALLVRVSLCLLVGVLVGSGYLHALNLVPAGSCLLVVRVSLWFVSARVSLLEVITLLP